MLRRWRKRDSRRSSVKSCALSGPTRCETSLNSDMRSQMGVYKERSKGIPWVMNSARLPVTNSFRCSMLFTCFMPTVWI